MATCKYLTFTKRASLLLFIGFLAACSSSQTLTSNTADDARQTESVSTKGDPDSLISEEPPKNWHLLSPERSGFAGIAADQAYREILTDMRPERKVVVAVLDSGTDIDHEDLISNIWRNPREIAGDGIDNDENGYVDDVHGWNFIGGSDGRHVNEDTYEATRLYKKLSEFFSTKDTLNLSDEERSDFRLYKEVRSIVYKEQEKAEKNLLQLSRIREALQTAKQYLDIDSLRNADPELVTPDEADNAFTQQAKQIIQFFLDNGFTEEDLDNEYDYFYNRRNYYYNPEFNPRSIVGDEYSNPEERYYGNNDVAGPRTDHGTHVAGIIGADRTNGIGIMGVADHVELMILRVVPDGDERDKDVANAIRYAAENGADIINMSFGKGYSPYKEVVDEALRFADQQGVLVIHSAGNGSQNIDSTRSYPSRFYLDGGQARNFLTVGASSYKADSTLAASFTNYGNSVDLFAPGVAIYSTYPNNDYELADGTSMAGPVVAGASALLMSYFPNLSADEVKDIILSTVTEYPGLMVYKPGTREAVPFSSLSATGGILNLYEAVKLARTKAMGTQ